jgi:Arc/MetJ-type ribon-helix-helix transcriptional regulator
MKPQINLRLPEEMRKMAEKYAQSHGFKNIQELAKTAIREKVMEKNYDESFTPKEIELIDRLVDSSISKGRLATEKELMKALK